MDETAPVARYALYGEPVQPVEPRFVHVEPIPLRSGPVAWRIAPHAHAELHQLLVVTAGGGRMRIEAETVSFAAPALLVVPAGLAHGFDFAPGTDGWIASVAETMLTPALRGEPAVAALLARGRGLGPLTTEAAAALAAVCAALARELVWAGPAHRLAVEAELLRLLVLAARTLAPPRDPALDPADVALTDRFRQRVEARFREGDPIAAYARALGVSQDRLLGACRRRFGEPPVRILNRRLLVEAQRWLIYTGRPIAEIGAALGFPDPTYFSRFFRRGTGASPRAYRARAQGPSQEPPIAEGPPMPHLAG